MKRSLSLRLAPSTLPATCEGREGTCLQLTCSQNLLVEVTPRGSLRVPATPGVLDAITLPAKRIKSGQGDVARLSRKLSSRRMDPVTNRVMSRARYLVDGWGSVCLRWLRRQRPWAWERAEVAEIMGVSRERVRQIEEAGLRSGRDGRFDALGGDCRPPSGIVPKLRGRQSPHQRVGIVEGIGKYAKPHGSTVRRGALG